MYVAMVYQMGAHWNLTSLEDFKENLSPRIMGAEQEPVVLLVPGQGDVTDAAGGGQNGGVLSPGAAAAAAAWSDSRPFSEQGPTYPATCLLAAVFVTVRRKRERHGRLVCVSDVARTPNLLSRYVNAVHLSISSHFSLHKLLHEIYTFCIRSRSSNNVCVYVG